MAHGLLNEMALRNQALGFLLSALLYSTIGQTAPRLELEPEFLAPLENHTVIQGRDVFFTCIVNHLQSYKVAWIKSDSRAILAMHTHMVAPNPRLHVTHNGHNTWKLHVVNVQPDDSGTYMCQVNTDPMRSQIGHMKVVIPPDIMDLDETIDRLTSYEHGEVWLRCRATGSPKPEVTWRREDGRKIVMRSDNAPSTLVKMQKGEHLHLIGILRQEMGSYLCIASNGVPPTVSKRYYVNVLFKPTIKIRDQIVAAQVNSDVALECYVESSPKSLTTWYTESGVKVAADERHTVTETALNDYTYKVNLIIRRIQLSDFSTSYTCFTENSIGKTSAVIRLRAQRKAKTTAVPFRNFTDRKNPIKDTSNKSRKTHNNLNDLEKTERFTPSFKGEMTSLARSDEDESEDVEYSNLPAASGAHYGSTDFPGWFSLSGSKRINQVASWIVEILVGFVLTIS